MGAAAQAAMAGAKPGANPQGKGFYQGNIGGFLSNNTAENERWMRQNAKTGAFTWNPQANAYVRKEGPGIVSLWRADGYQLKTGVKDQGLWDFANTRGGPAATPSPTPGPNTPLAPAPPSTPGPAPGPPGGPTSNDDVTLGGTGRPDQKFDPTPWDPYSTGTPIANEPPPTTGGGFLAPPQSTKPYEAAKAIYTDSTGLQKPRQGPAGGASMGGSTLGGMAPQSVQRPQVATTGVADGPMGRPSPAPIAGLPQMPQNQAIKPAQPQTPPTAGGPENAAPVAPVGPDPRQMYGQQVAKARAAYGAWPMADDPKAPQPKFTPGKSYYNAFTGMWGRA